MNKTEARRRREIQAEARTWVGTPYRHQARLKGAGVDCVGLCIGVGLALGLLPAMTDEAWQPFADYGRAPNPDRMGEGLETFLTQILAQERAPGDWAWIQWRTPRGREMPMHLAMLADGPNGPTLIHAYASAARCVEHGFTAGWPELVKAWYRYPVLEASVNAADRRQVTGRRHGP